MTLITWMAVLAVLKEEMRSRDDELTSVKLQAASGVLERERHRIASFSIDYGAWDETVAFLNGNDENYLERYFSYESLKSLGLDFLALQSTDGTIIRTIDFTRSENFPSMSIIRNNHLTELLDRLAHNTQSLSSTIGLIDERPVLVARGVITDTLRTAEGYGWLVSGRFLDGNVLRTMHADAGFAFDLVRAGTTSDVLGHHGERPLSASTLAVRLTAANAPTGPTALTSQLLVIVLLSVFFLSACAVLWLVDAAILLRLRRFGAIVRNHESKGYSLPRWPCTDQDELGALALAFNDLMERIEARSKNLNALATTDELTGLGNRRKLIERIESLSNRFVGETPAHVLLLLDVDDFKLVNDGIGHSAGDRVLAEFGQRIERMLGPTDLGVRLGGDELAVLIEGDCSSARSFYERLRASLTLPVMVDGRAVVMGVSVGLAESNHSISAEDWLLNADTAMYHSKRNGKNRATFFQPAMRTAAQRRVHLAQELRKAVNARTLEVWFQPIMDARTGRVYGLEALLRWRRGNEFVAPAEFIPVAEESGMIVRLGQLVILQSCAVLERLRTVHPSLRCNINLSVQQFMQGDLERDLDAALSCYHLTPNAITLEITENQVACHEEHVLSRMQELTARGFVFALDDFGVGHSSLDRLRRLPVSTLKIDRSFVAPLTTGEDPMIGHIIALASDLGLLVVAEGVEDEATSQRLLALGCTYMQGYHYAKAMTEASLRLWLQHRIVDPRASS